MIDERKLKRLRVTAQVVAALSLAVFAGLIAFSAYRLRGIQQELRQSAADLAGQQAELRETAARKVELEGEIAELEKGRQALTATLQDFTARVDAQDSGLAIRATSEAIAANPEAAAILPRIYLHVRDEQQRPAAKEVAARLRQSGFLIPGIENVGPDRSPQRTELRRFRRTDQDERDVQAALSALREAGIAAEVKLIQGYENSTRIRQRHYELWFGKDFPPPPGTRIQVKRSSEPAAAASVPP